HWETRTGRICFSKNATCSAVGFGSAAVGGGWSFFLKKSFLPGEFFLGASSAIFLNSSSVRYPSPFASSRLNRKSAAFGLSLTGGLLAMSLATSSLDGLPSLWVSPSLNAPSGSAAGLILGSWPEMSVEVPTRTAIQRHRATTLTVFRSRKRSARGPGIA